MTDDYTMEMRLCDDAGMVSHVEIEEDFESADKTYLERLNRLRNMTLTRRGDKPEFLDEPFACTGNAHLAGQHIRCTSPAHQRRVTAVIPDPNLIPVGSILPFPPGSVPSGWIQLQGQTITADQEPGLLVRLVGPTGEPNYIEAWRYMGGEIGNDHAVLPNVTTYEEANRLVFGNVYNGFNPMPMVLAIRARRDENA